MLQEDLVLVTVGVLKVSGRTRRFSLAMATLLAPRPGRQRGAPAAPGRGNLCAVTRRAGTADRRPDLHVMPNSGRCPRAYSCIAWHIPSRLMAVVIDCVNSLLGEP